MKQKKYKYIDEEEADYLDRRKINKLIKNSKSSKKVKNSKDDFTESDDWEYEG